jgi:hypothetical protein
MCIKERFIVTASSRAMHHKCVTPAHSTDDARDHVARVCDGETAGRRGWRGVWNVEPRRGVRIGAGSAQSKRELLSRRWRARDACAPVAPGRSTCLFYHILAPHVPRLVPIESASHADSRPTQPLAWHEAETLVALFPAQAANPEVCGHMGASTEAAGRRESPRRETEGHRGEKESKSIRGLCVRGGELGGRGPSRRGLTRWPRWVAFRYSSTTRLARSVTRLARVTLPSIACPRRRARSPGLAPRCRAGRVR